MAENTSEVQRVSTKTTKAFMSPLYPTTHLQYYKDQCSLIKPLIKTYQALNSIAMELDIFHKTWRRIGVLSARRICNSGQRKMDGCFLNVISSYMHGELVGQIRYQYIRDIVMNEGSSIIQELCKKPITIISYLSQLAASILTLENWLDKSYSGMSESVSLVPSSLLHWSPNHKV